MKQINLGDEAIDTVSGFKGIVIGRTQWLSGCDTIGLRPKIDKNGKLMDAVWFDIMQLKILKKAKVVIENRNTGGPIQSVPAQNTTPK